MNCILSMDIGGTNTSVGIFDGKLNQLHFFSAKTKEKSPYGFAKEIAGVVKQKSMRIVAAGIAVAGPVQNGSVRLPNAGISLSVGKFKDILEVKNTIMLNDFEAVAYALNALKKNDAIPLTKNKPKEKSVKVVLGAGTGLGKAVLYFDKKLGFHVPLSAEEGHTAIAIATPEEFALLEFIKKREYADVVWEDVLSGRGIASIYEFVQQKKRIKNSVAREIESSRDKASIISKYRKTDASCKETFKIFSRIYARFIRNSMLQSLPYGGVYVAGGVAIKNMDIFQSKEFKAELYKSAVFVDIIKKIPLFVFKSTAIGLKGAAFAAKKLAK